MLSFAEEWPIRAQELDDDTRAAILDGIEQAKRGEFVSDEEIEALWNRYNLLRVAAHRQHAS
jgi:predicted transcriptional regulator